MVVGDDRVTGDDTVIGFDTGSGMIVNQQAPGIVLKTVSYKLDRCYKHHGGEPDHDYMCFYYYYQF